jgi:TonB family protein
MFLKNTPLIVLFFLSAISASAQCRLESGRRPESGDDLAKLYAFLSDKVPPQGEFEKTAAYDLKVKSLLAQTVVGDLKGDSLWKGIRCPWSVSYNPDSEIMDVFFETYYSASRPSAPTDNMVFDLPDESKKTFMYGDIGFRMLNYATFTSKASDARPARRGETHGIYISFHVPINIAREVKANLYGVFIFHAAKPFRDGNIVARGGLTGIVEKLQLFDAVTGKIYYDSSSGGPKDIAAVKKPPLKVDEKTLGNKIRSFPVFPVVKTPGLVVVQIIVSETGKVESAKFVSGPLALKETALELIKRWDFQPTLLSGVPVRVTGRINMKFSRLVDSRKSGL